MKELESKVYDLIHEEVSKHLDELGVLLDDARSKVDSKNKLKDNAKASVVLSRISVKNTKTKYGVKNGS